MRPEKNAELPHWRMGPEPGTSLGMGGGVCIRHAISILFCPSAPILPSCHLLPSLSMTYLHQHSVGEAMERDAGLPIGAAGINRLKLFYYIAIHSTLLVAE